MSRRGSAQGIAVIPQSHGGSLMWDEILRDYDESHAYNEDQQISWFRRQPSLRVAIETAARATDDREKRYDHQYRIRRIAITQATAALLASERALATVTSFDDLLSLVFAQVHQIDGIGELYCYDTALRIGAYLGQFPTRVHLHRGTRAGAMALGLDYHQYALEMADFPPELRGRQPIHVENILCIYRDRFGASMKTRTRRRSRC